VSDQSPSVPEPSASPTSGPDEPTHPTSEVKEEPRAGGDRMQRQRECITHLLALAIVLSTIFTALWSFWFLGDGDQMDDAKALLAVMSGLSGVVIGYYFGRVPAEGHASQMHEQMRAAMAESEHAKSSMRNMTRMLDNLEDRAASEGQVGAEELRKARREMGSA
jgi:hypothetical protein